MDRSLDSLQPEMKEKALQLVEASKARGVDIMIYCTRRTLEEQAVFFRQSRRWHQIETKIKELRSKGYEYLADVIEEVGPQYGPHVTNAAPGESWHNYGLALDAVILIRDVPVWDTKNSGWRRYGDAAKAVGLTWGGTWKSFPDFVHVQYYADSNPLKRYTPDQVVELCQLD